MQFIIEEYTCSAEPVGSELITRRYLKDFSGATIRNEMQELEGLGLLTHPHTSAGRVPTEAGYRFYLENLLVRKKLDAGKQKSLQQAARQGGNAEERIKSLAKKTAELAEEAVVVGFNPHNVFYTGLTNLFNKPEFSSQELVLGISRVIDHLDEVMSRVHEKVDSDISVFLGRDNPFGVQCGAVLTACRLNKEQGVIGILGPIRMDYGENIAYVKFIKSLLENN